MTKKKKDTIFSSVDDFVTYGRARSAGFSSDMALAILDVKKAFKKGGH